MNAVTNAELDAFYGKEATQYEIAHACTKAVRALDADDFADVIHANVNQFKAAISDGNTGELYALFASVLKDTAARRASMDVYGRVGVITAADISLGAL
jgi:hypothetical protein